MTKAIPFLVAFFLIGVIAVDSENKVTTVSDIENGYSNLNISDDEIYFWYSTNYPDAYPVGNKSLNVVTDDGYYLKINIIDLSLNAEDVLIISSGSESDGENEYISVYNSTSEREFLFSSNIVFLSFVAIGEKGQGYRGFNLTIQRYHSSPVTTTEEPLETSETPTTIEDTVTVLVGGKAAGEYYNKEPLLEFKNAVVGMATEYCSKNNILLGESITTNDVNITYLMSCPLNWAEPTTCVQITFFLPVVLADNSTSEYQLNSTHLQNMWTGLGNSYLTNYDLYIYINKDPVSYLTLWVLIFSIVLVVFMITLYLVRFMVYRRLKKAMIRNKSFNADVSTYWNDTNSTNEFQLGPHPLQDVPPFFKPQIRDFEPGKTGLEPPIGNGREYAYDTLEDDTDENTVYARKITSYPQGSTA